MMASLEQEIMERVRQMDDGQKAALLSYLDQSNKTQLTLAEWLDMANQSRQETLAKYGEDFRVDVQSLLDEVREEPTDERLGRR